MAEIDPAEAIDRDVEQEEFTKLVRFTAGEDARLLIIKDKADSGKTTLLRRLRYNCERILEPSKAVCLISLDDANITSPFELIKRAVESFSSPDFDTFTALNFAGFQACNRNRMKHIFSQVDTTSPTYAGTVNAQNAQLGTGTVTAGNYFNNPQNVTIHPGPEWNDEQNELAREDCINEFFKDLKAIGDQTPVVMLLDSFDERCQRPVRDWILKKLVSICFDLKNRPSQFVLVLAGRGELPDFSKKPAYASLIKSRSSLENWTKEHVRDFLRVHDFDGLTDKEFEMIWEKVQNGEAIGRVLPLAKFIKLWRQQSDAA